MVQLLCVPGAGRTAATYRHWQRWHSTEVTVVPLELPGRGELAEVPPEPDIARLAHWLSDSALAAAARSPIALLGHSMGALIAFELAHLLERQNVPIRHIFVLACKPPGSREPASRPALAGMDSDNRLLAALAQHPALPESVRADHDVLKIGLSWLRADIQACESYRPDPRPPLRCPITVMLGRYDQSTGSADAAGWAAHTRARFRVMTVPAGHDLPDEAAEFVRRCVERTLVR